MPKIENYKYSIQQAFRECLYIVPDYQREYVWTEKEVNQLLDDLNDSFENKDEEYFLGTILVSKNNAENDINSNSLYDVIDGQQRLTTLFLIIIALRSLIIDENYSQYLNELISNTYTNENTGQLVKKIKLDPKYENANTLIQKIIDIKSNPIKVYEKIENSHISVIGSVKNILLAYTTIYTYFSNNYEDNNKLKQYWGFLANKVVFIQILTDINSALKIFETINERGVGLNPMDLLKNLLFTQVSNDQFEKLKNQWKNITSTLEKHNEKPLRFLRYYLMANYSINNNRNDNIVREDEIYSWFIDANNINKCNYKEKPFDFISDLKINLDLYIGFKNGKDNKEEISIDMQNLRLMSGESFSLYFILFLSIKNFPKDLFIHFIRQLENFLLYYFYTKSSTKELERLFSIWADKLREINNENNINTKIRSYNLFLNEYFIDTIKRKEKELEDALKRLTLNSMQQYRTRYLLAKITKYVDEEFRGSGNNFSIKSYMELDIEHILPNTPTDEIMNQFVNVSPTLDYDEYKNHLGNLMLLEKTINIVVGNKPFVEKKVDYEKSIYYLNKSIVEKEDIGKNTKVTKLNEILISFNDWTASSIEERQQMLIKFIPIIWKIEEYILPVPEEKTQSKD